MKAINVLKKSARVVMGSLLYRTLGETRGLKIMKRIRRPFLERMVAYEKYTANPDGNLVDNNIPLTDQYCPICDSESRFVEISDNVGMHLGLKSRKILHQCNKCKFLCTNERRGKREDFYVDTPYASDRKGHRGQREVDLVNLVARTLGKGKDACILIYGLGTNNSLAKLEEEGYSNYWGSDIAEGLPYNERYINMAKDPDFFTRQGIEFDVVVVCEVWEHFDRHHMNDSFEGQFKLIKPTGVVIGTTALWSAENDYPDFSEPDEYGLKQLGWWDYPHALDHTSFYREVNLATIAARFDLRVYFAYFCQDFVHINDPFKRIIAFVKQNNEEGLTMLEADFERKQHLISY